jgi:hypothetical protein
VYTILGPVIAEPCESKPPHGDAMSVAYWPPLPMSNRVGSLIINDHAKSQVTLVTWSGISALSTQSATSLRSCGLMPLPSPHFSWHPRRYFGGTSGRTSALRVSCAKSGSRRPTATPCWTADPLPWRWTSGYLVIIHNITVS